MIISVCLCLPSFDLLHLMVMLTGIWTTQRWQWRLWEKDQWEGRGNIKIIECDEGTTKFFPFSLSCSNVEGFISFIHSVKICNPHVQFTQAQRVSETEQEAKRAAAMKEEVELNLTKSKEHCLKVLQTHDVDDKNEHHNKLVDITGTLPGHTYFLLSAAFIFLTAFICLSYLYRSWIRHPRQRVWATYGRPDERTSEGSWGPSR